MVELHCSALRNPSLTHSRSVCQEEHQAPASRLLLASAKPYSVPFIFRGACRRGRLGVVGLSARTVRRRRDVTRGIRWRALNLCFGRCARNSVSRFMSAVDPAVVDWQP